MGLSGLEICLESFVLSHRVGIWQVGGAKRNQNTQGPKAMCRFLSWRKYIQWTGQVSVPRGEPMNQNHTAVCPADLLSDNLQLFPTHHQVLLWVVNCQHKLHILSSGVVKYTRAIDESSKFAFRKWAVCLFPLLLLITEGKNICEQFNFKIRYIIRSHFSMTMSTCCTIKGVYWSESELLCPHSNYHLPWESY